MGTRQDINYYVIAFWQDRCLSNGNMTGWGGGGGGWRRRTFKTVDTAWRAIRNCSCVFNLIMTGEGVSLFIFISNAMYIFRFFCGHLRTTQNSLNYVCIHICLHGCLICWKSEIWSLIVIINCICSVCKFKKSKGIWRAFREKREHFNQSLYRICVTWPT